MCIRDSKAHDAAQGLPQHGGHGGPQHAHAGRAQQAEDADGVQHDVGNRARELAEHLEHGAAGDLDQAFQADLQLSLIHI